MARMKSMDEVVSRQKEIDARMAEIDSEAGVDFLGEESAAEFRALAEERARNEELIAEIKFRAEAIAKQAEKSESRESAAFGVPAVKRDRDIYDVAAARAETSTDEQFVEVLRDNAMRSLDTSVIAAGGKEAVEQLIEQDRGRGDVSRRILQTGSATYKRAFAKYVAGQRLNAQEQDALERTSMSAGTTTAGGYAIPYTLDPTVIHSSNLSVNPYRGLCKEVRLTGSNTWQGVSSAGVTASFDAELAEVSDDSPTFAQPTATLRMARAFVQYSMELDDDWASLQTEMAGLFSDAKDDLEGSEFTTGSGTAPHPLGLLETANTTGIGTAAFVFTAGTAAFAIGDVYKLENALGARWRPRASIMANRAWYNAVRQFDTAGGAGLFVQNLQLGLDKTFPTGGQLGASVLGYPAYENSNMSTTYTTTGQVTAVIGDFSKFVIVDGVGMNVELVPQLFNTANNLPDGRRGLFARWRTATAVTAPLAFKALKVL